MLLAPEGLGRTQADSSLLSKYGALLDIGLRTFDLVCVVVAAFVAYWLRFHSISLREIDLEAVVQTALLVLIIFPSLSIYRSWRVSGLLAEISRVVLAWSAVVCLTIGFTWLLKGGALGAYSRLWIAIWYVLGLCLLCTGRVVVRLALGAIRARGVDARSIVLVGATEASAKVLAATHAHPWMGLKVVGYVSTPYDQTGMRDVPCLGTSDSFLGELTSRPPDQLWIALPLSAEKLIERLVKATGEVATTVRLVPDIFGYSLINHHATSFAGMPLITLRGTRIDGHARVVKALEDRVLSAIILTLISPLLLILALAVKLTSKGPIFYRQKRVGLDGKEFEMLKFRSMPVDVERQGVKWGQAKAKKTTPIGGFLRKTSLDELPQFINVLKGDLSIVGPRPERPVFVHEFKKSIPGYMHKHLVKAGITGWAQIHGWRGDTDLKKRIECDLYYINNWSFWMDIKIIFLTPLSMIIKRNAY